MAERTCSVEGCQNRYYARERCENHYKQWKRRNPDAPSLIARGINRNQSASGYWWVTPPLGHFFYKPGRTVMQHRVVLFDKIGLGPHLCHWCGRHINWGGVLQSDHLDTDRSNNDPSNLVPSCPGCNSRRSLGATPDRCFRGHLLDAENSYVSTAGRSPRRVCRTCTRLRTAAYRQRKRAAALSARAFVAAT